MILQIYHCNLAIIADKYGAGGAKAKSSAKQVGIKDHISNVGENDVMILPPCGQLITVHRKKCEEQGETVEVNHEVDLGRLLGEFQHIDPFETHLPSFVRIDWELLAIRLNIPVARVEALAQEAHKRGLLKGLTIDYDLQKWLHHSRDKGALIIMTCIEKFDYENESIAESFACRLADLRDHMINREHGDFLNTAVVVPNVHLAEKENVGTDHSKNTRILNDCCDALRSRGFDVKFNSYGRAKTLILGIDGHQSGGFMRWTIRPTSKGENPYRHSGRETTTETPASAPR